MNRVHGKISDDCHIIKGLKSADARTQQRSFKLLYDKYFNALVYFIWQYVKSSETAREIAQDAFVRLWIHHAELDETRSVKAYLFTISRHSLIKELRRQIKNPLMREYVDFIGGLSVEDRLTYDYDTFTVALRKGKLTLTTRQREIFELNRETGFSVKQIASRLGIKEQVVRNQLSSAICKMRKYLADNFTEI